MLARVITAFIPTGIIGFALYKVVKTYFMNSEAIVLWSLFLGGVVLIVFELLHRRSGRRRRRRRGDPLFEMRAHRLVSEHLDDPGVSRAGATIIGGLILSLSRSTIVEFSFLLAVPTMLAATLYDLYKNAATFAPQEFGVLAAGFISSFVFALLAIKLLLAYVRTNTFIPFGIYRISVAARLRLPLGARPRLRRELELGVAGHRRALDLHDARLDAPHLPQAAEFPQQAPHILRKR